MWYTHIQSSCTVREHSTLPVFLVVHCGMMADPLPQHVYLQHPPVRAYHLGTLASVSDELLFDLLTYLTPDDLCRVGGTCLSLHRCSAVNAVWGFHVLADNNGEPLPEHSGQWKVTYVRSLLPSQPPLPPKIQRSIAALTSPRAQLLLTQRNVQSQLLFELLTRQAADVSDFEPLYWGAGSGTVDSRPEALHCYHSAVASLHPASPAQITAHSLAAIQASMAAALDMEYNKATHYAHPSILPRLRTPPTRATFHTDFEQPGIPFVWEGAVPHWPAFAEWTMAGLERILGDAQLSISHRAGAFHDVDLKVGL